MRTKRSWWRAVAVVAIVLPLSVAAVAIDDFHRSLLETCTGETLCATFEQPTPETLDLLRTLGIPASVYAVSVTVMNVAQTIVWAGVGGLLLWFRPIPRVSEVHGILLSASAIGWLTPDVSTLFTSALLVIALGLFPDGRWWPEWLGRTWPLLAFLALAAGIGEVMGSGPASVVLTVLGFFPIVIAVLRYRLHSDWVARQQTKWVLIGSVVLVGNVCLAIVAELGGWIDRAQLLLIVVAYVALTLLPVGLALALFRFRLYGVDGVLRRTVVSTAVAVGILVAYAVVVALSGFVLTRGESVAFGAAAAAVVAVAAAIVAARTRTWSRARLFGTVTPSRLLMESAATRFGGAQSNFDLAGALARNLDVAYVAITDADGQTLWEHGEARPVVHVEPVVDASGEPVGHVVLGAHADDGKLGRYERRALREAVPYVSLVLRMEAEAAALRQARTVAATAREDERRRLRRDLHDGVGPLLASQLLALDGLRMRKDDQAQVVEHVEAQTRSAIGEIRRIARDLGPSSLDAGLSAALETEVGRFSTGPMRVTLECRGELTGAGAAVEAAVVRIVQESLANAARHSGADTCAVRVTAHDDAFNVEVEDDGVGPHGEPGVGTTSMQDRARELGGSVRIEHGTHGVGTRVRARVPR